MKPCQIRTFLILRSIVQKIVCPARYSVEFLIDVEIDIDIDIDINVDIDAVIECLDVLTY